MSRGPGSTQRWLLDKLSAFENDFPGVWVPLGTLARLFYAERHGGSWPQKPEWLSLRPATESVRRAAKGLPGQVDLWDLGSNDRVSRLFMRRAGWSDVHVLDPTLDGRVKIELSVIGSIVNDSLRAIGSRHRLAVEPVRPVEHVPVLFLDEDGNPSPQNYVGFGFHARQPPRADDEAMLDQLFEDPVWKDLPMGTVTAIVSALVASDPDIVARLAPLLARELVRTAQ